MVHTKYQFVLGPCFIMWSWCPFYFSNHYAEEERAGCFTLIAMWLCFSESLPRGAIGWSAV